MMTLQLHLSYELGFIGTEPQYNLRHRSVLCVHIGILRLFHLTVQLRCLEQLWRAHWKPGGTFPILQGRTSWDMHLYRYAWLE